PAPLLRETYRFIGACAFRATSVRPQNRQFRLKNLMSDRLLAGIQDQPLSAVTVPAAKIPSFLREIHAFGCFFA
ncbi:MAG: hypothetical protein WCW52_04275, partial [Elusimicrobiales bacterium]